MAPPQAPTAAPQTSSRALPWLLVAVLLFGLAVWYVWPLTIDDAFISARYARNLAQGEGLVYNPGDPPSEGYSNLTLVLLTAAGVRLGAEAITVAKVVGALCGALCLLLAALAGRIVVPRHYHYAVLLCATCFPLILWSTAGLETTLMALLAALWLYLGLRLVVSGEGRMQWPLAAVTVLAALTRPEGLLFIPTLAVLLGWAKRRQLRASWWPLAAAAVALGLHEVWRVAYFGLWLPLPFYAKVEVGNLLDKLSGVYYLHTFLWSYGGGLAVYLALAHAWRQRRSAAGAPGAVLLLSLTPFFVFVLAVGADWMPQFRFLAPTVVPLSLLLVGLLAALADGFEPTIPALQRHGRFLLACSIAALLLGNVVGGWRAFSRQEWHGTKLERLDVHRGASVALQQQGLWLRDHGGSLLTVAAMDIGAPGYYSDAHVIDMHGLTSPDLAGRSREQVADYVLQRHPDYIQVYGHVLQHRPEFRRDYVRTDVPWNLYARRTKAP